jgi:hypothetical protein
MSATNPAMRFGSLARSSLPAPGFKSASASSKRDALVATQKHQSDWVAGSHFLADDVHAFQSFCKTRLTLDPVTHAEGGIDRDHHSCATLARHPRGAFFPNRARESEHEEQQSQTTQNEQQQIAQLQLTRAHSYTAIQETHRRPVSVLHLETVEQVRENRQTDAERCK